MNRNRLPVQGGIKHSIRPGRIKASQVAIGAHKTSTYVRTVNYNLGILVVFAEISCVYIASSQPASKSIMLLHSDRSQPSTSLWPFVISVCICRKYFDWTSVTMPVQHGTPYLARLCLSGSVFYTANRTKPGNP